MHSMLIVIICHHDLQGLVSSVYFKEQTAVSLLVLVVESHSLVFVRPGNPKASENDRPVTRDIEKAPHERNRQTTMSHGIDRLCFCR